jgi:hypothetical protein
MPKSKEEKKEKSFPRFAEAMDSFIEAVDKFLSDPKQENSPVAIEAQKLKSRMEQVKKWAADASEGDHGQHGHWFDS